MRKILFNLILLSFLSFGLMALAQDSSLSDPGLTPDSPFYFLKSWKESIQLFFTFGEENKAKQFLHLADVRLAEYQKMIEKGKTEIAQKTLDKYEKQLSRALEKVDQAQEKGKDMEKLKEAISEKILKHQEVLESVLEKVPEQAKEGIEKAIESSRRGFEKVTERELEEAKEPEVKEEQAKEKELPKEEVILPKSLPKASLKVPVIEVTARPAEISSKNSPIRTVFGITFVLAQEFETGKELQVEIREAPPKEIDSFQTWTVGYVIKNTTDSSFVLAYNIAPSEYKTSGAVVVDPDGDGPKKWFYYTFGEDVLLAPKSEQYFNISFSPPKGLTEITPRIVFKGFSTQEPLFTHEFTVKVTYVPPPAECETPICPEGKIIYWRGAVDNYKCPMLECVLPGIKCAIISPNGSCAVAPQPCEELTYMIGNGWTIADQCSLGAPERPEDCAIISPKGVCAESTSQQCTWNLPPEGWDMVDKCPD